MFDIKEELKKLPDSPGVYIHKDEFGQVIYVGKAKNLKNRVSSYFTRIESHNRKTYALVSQIESFDVMKTAAGNTGSGSDLMGAGMGLGMGVGMGKAFGIGMDSMAQGAMNAANTSATPCPNCGTPVAAGAQFCSGCGQKIVPAGNACKNCGTALPAGTKFCPMCGAKAEPQGIICPGCGQELPLGSKFCSGCGQKLVVVCKGCGKELAPGAKFCDNCGTPAQ